MTTYQSYEVSASSFKCSLDKLLPLSQIILFSFTSRQNLIVRQEKIFLESVNCPSRVQELTHAESINFVDKVQIAN